jgi:hypothetical protein
MQFSIDNKIYSFLEGETLRFQGRDVILIECEDGWKQGFYRSSGRNSGRAGRWFPFDGYLFGLHWFIKDRFCIREQYGTDLERYGFEVLHDIGNLLGALTIPEGKTVDGTAINDMVGLHLKYWEKQPYFKH